MLRSVIPAVMLAVVPLSAAAAQTAPAHDHAAHAQDQAARPQPSSATPPGHPMGGMTGQGSMAGGTMDHTKMKEGQACECPCMKQDKGTNAATKKPPLHDHRKEHKQQ